MNRSMKATVVSAAVGGMLVLTGPQPALAAHDSQAHAQHMELSAEGNPGWAQMREAPVMEGMMNSPPMHGAEHPGPDNPPDVVEEGPGQG